MQIQADGYAAIWSEPINTTEDLEPIQLQLNTGGNIIGQVLDPKGQPISAVIVKVVDGVSSDVSVDGQFELKNVADGIHEISAELVGYEPAKITVEVAVGLTTQDAIIIMTPVE